MKRRSAPILTFTVGLLLFGGLAYALKKKRRAKPPLPREYRDEQREHSRLDLYAQALIMKEGTESVCSGEITNISDLGVYMATNGLFSTDDLVDLTIYFQHDAKKLSITVPCKVVRIDEKGVGLSSAHIETNILQELELIFYVNRDNTKKLIEELSKADSFIS
jgi:PilZ domain